MALAVVDDVELTALAIPPDPAQHLAVAADHGDDLGAIRTYHDGAGFVAELLSPDIARAVPESIFLVVTDERLAAGIDHDDPAGFGEDLATALVALVAVAAEIFHAPRSLRGGARRDRSHGLSLRWGGRNRRGDRRRCATGQRAASRWQRGLTSPRCRSSIRCGRSGVRSCIDGRAGTRRCRRRYTRACGGRCPRR